MRIHSKLRSVLFVTLALSTTAQIALPVLAQGVIAPAKVDSGSYGPIVTIVSPEYSDVIKGETQISIAIAPRRYPAQSVELLVDGRSVSGVLPVQTKFAWKTGMFIDGPHTLGVRVTDTQGFIGQSETTVYINNQRKLDDKSPILRWLGVTSGETLSGVTKFRLEAADDFGVKYVFLNLNTAIAPDVKPPVASWMTNRPPYEFSIDTSKYEDGMYVLDAYAWDDMENERNALRLNVSFANHGSVKVAIPEPVEATTTDVATYAPPAKPPVASFSSTLRTGVMEPEPVKATVKAPSPLQSTSVITSAISRPSVELRPQPKSVQIKPEAPKTVETPRVTPPVAAPHTSNTPVPQRLTVLPDLSSRSSQGTPGLTSIENVIKSQTIHAAATAATIDAPERQATTRVVLATAPNAGSRVSTVQQSHSQKPVQNVNANTVVSITPTITVAGSREMPTDVTVSISPAGTAKTSPQRIASAYDVLPTAPKAPAASIGRLPLPANTLDAVQETQPSVAPRVTARDVERTAVQTRSTRPLFSALPDRQLVTPQVSALDRHLTPVEQSPRTRIAAPTFAVPSRTVNVSSIPTLPRLAIAPPVVKWSDKTTAKTAISGAAIVVAPATPDAQPYYLSTKNDTLAAIASRYKMPVSALAAANNLPQNARVNIGTKVLLPQALTISYKGQAVTGDVAPLLIGSTSVAPFRFLFEKQGGKMSWDAAGQRVTANNGTYEVTIEVGSDKAIVNKEEVLMDMAAFLLSGRTMVPVRFFEKALHAKVEWDPSTGRIFVAMTPNS